MSPANNVLVSTIIPAYNTARYLAQAIESALRQSHSPVEVIVVDDGSTDNTGEVVASYQDRITYIRQENRGLSAARNAGFRASRGDLICFLDADDILLPDKFARQLAVFEREPDVGIVISGYIDVAEDGETPIQTVVKEWHRDALDHLLNHEVFPTHTALVCRDVLACSPLFPEEIETTESQEDWQLWLDLALKGVQFLSIPEPTVKYRRRPGSISANPLKHLDGARRVVRWLKEHPQAQGYGPRVERLGAIVEMERVAAAFRTRQKGMAGELLAAAVRESPRYWMEPTTYLRLFEGSLTLPENVEWRKHRDLAWFERRVMKEILPFGKERVGALEYARLCAAAMLELSDLAYGASDHRKRRRALAGALSFSPSVCASTAARASTIRGILGPEIVGWLRHPFTSPGARHA